jgi:hypothetical protein
MNQVYVAENPVDEDLYERKEMTMKDIYLEVVHLTNLFDDQSMWAFFSWCGKARLDFLKSEQVRKYRKDEEMTRYRSLGTERCTPW